MSPLKFDHTVATKWPTWKKTFELNMEVADKSSATESQKIAILLTHMGQEAIELHKTFDSPKETLAEVIEHFDKRCIPTTNLAVESYKFSKITQPSDKSFDQYLTELKLQAADCNFVCGNNKCKTPYVDRMIIDHIVSHINDTEVQQTLLREKKPLKLADVIQTCRTAEAVKSGQKEMEQETESAAVNEMRKKYKKEKKMKSNARRLKNEEKKSYDCKKCGLHHQKSKCPAYGDQCRNCKG
ncbi:unnamed protein product, partial [Nesidiocoris tenuis]